VRAVAVDAGGHELRICPLNIRHKGSAKESPGNGGARRYHPRVLTLIGGAPGKRRAVALFCAAASGLLVACRRDPPPVQSDIPSWRVERTQGAEARVFARGRYAYHFDMSGVARRITFDLNSDGRPEAAATLNAAGATESIEFDWNANGKPERREWRAPLPNVRPLIWGDRGNDSRWSEFEGLAAAPPPFDIRTRRPHADQGSIARAVRGALRGGSLTRVELDSDGDERIDREQIWVAGRVNSETVDTDGDGALDLRLEYSARGVVTTSIRRAAGTASPATASPAPRK
jgi:hypothetical protein